MAKRISQIVLTAVVLLTVTNNSFAIDRHRVPSHSQSRRHPVIRSRRVPMVHSPLRRIIISPTVVAERTVSVWITNNNGSQTEVKLTSVSTGGYTGPNGEYYPTMPTEDQLKTVYGLECAAPMRNNVIVYLINSDGTETVVVLTKDGSEYMGPKGERYLAMPAVEQLMLIYGN